MTALRTILSEPGFWLLVAIFLAGVIAASVWLHRRIVRQIKADAADRDDEYVAYDPRRVALDEFRRGGRL